MISELQDKHQLIIERLPVYADNGKRFIPGCDPCFTVWGEVVWADGAFGLTAYRIEEILLLWNAARNRWESSFGQKFYSSRDAAEKAKEIMEKVS